MGQCRRSRVLGGIGLLALAEARFLFDNKPKLCHNAFMINLLLALMSVPALAQNVVNSQAIIGKISPIVSESVLPSAFLKTVSLPPSQAVWVGRNSNFDARDAQPLIDPNLWSSLKPMPSSVAQWLSNQSLGIDLSQVRMIPLFTIEKIAQTAVNARDNSLTFMTDSGFTTPHIFYLSRGVCAALFSKYDFGEITLDSGVSKDGQKFQIQAMVVGNNKIYVIYNIDHFESTQPQYPQYPFIFRRIVTYTINGPGDLSVSGIKADAGIVHATIQDIEDAHNGYLQIDTDYGQQFVKSTPISVISVR